MTNRKRSFRLLFPVVAVGLGACASLGSWEDILAGAGGVGGVYGDEVRGEIRQVDTRRQEIELNSGWGRERVRYDRRTEVIYRQRRYDVRDLERGDRVRVRVDGRSSRDRYASVIYVEDGAGYDRGRDADYGRRERLDGRVQAIDTRSGWFEVSVDREGAVLVTLPYDPNRALRDRFRRLRRGDRVRLEVMRLNRGRAEVLRFL